MNEYWANRIATAQNAITDKNLKQIEKQMRKYYGSCAKRVIRDFEATYDKLLATIGEGKQPTPADLYKLNKYWEAQNQLRRELRKLSEKQVATLTKIFELQFFDEYHAIEIEGLQAFNTINAEGARALINSIWVADGKSFSQRIWDDTDKLLETLNEQLLHCVITGKKTTQLKQVLQERFGVSYNNADTIARTELAHIQTIAAQERYKSYGISEVQIWADADERRCSECGKLHRKIYPAGASVPIPAHPRCRCCIVPVIK